MQTLMRARRDQRTPICLSKSVEIMQTRWGETNLFMFEAQPHTYIHFSFFYIWINTFISSAGLRTQRAWCKRWKLDFLLLLRVNIKKLLLVTVDHYYKPNPVFTLVVIGHFHTMWHHYSLKDTAICFIGMLLQPSKNLERIHLLMSVETWLYIWVHVSIT